MSTYYGYVCRSHHPNIVSEHWINHGAEKLRDVAWIVRNGRWKVDENERPIPFYHDGVFWDAPIWWLLQHPHCDIALHNEYGVIEELHPGTEPPGRCGVPPTPEPNQG